MRTALRGCWAWLGEDGRWGTLIPVVIVVAVLIAERGSGPDDTAQFCARVQAMSDAQFEHWSEQATSDTLDRFWVQCADVDPHDGPTSPAGPFNTGD